MMGEGMMYGMHGGMGWWWFLNILFGVLVVAGLVLLVVWLVQRTGRPGGGRTDESALDILKKRYARGEITKEEYDAMKKHLA